MQYIYIYIYILYHTHILYMHVRTFWSISGYIVYQVKIAAEKYRYSSIIIVLWYNTGSIICNTCVRIVYTRSYQVPGTGISLLFNHVTTARIILVSDHTCCDYVLFAHSAPPVGVSWCYISRTLLLPKGHPSHHKPQGGVWVAVPCFPVILERRGSIMYSWNTIHDGFIV